MNRNTNTAGLPPADDDTATAQAPRRKARLYIGCFTMRRPRPKPPRRSPRRARHQQLDLDL